MGGADAVALLADGGCADGATGVDGRVVRPEVTSARRPLNARGSFKAASMAARISCGSAMRPKPYSPQAMSPSFGPTVITPRVFNVARLVRVASCSHMRTFIAGAASTGL